MPTETKIIILRGNSGSGKTSTARLLQKKFGHATMLISQDAIRREMLYIKDGLNNDTGELIIELLKFARKNCAIVILEGIFVSTWYEHLFDYIKKTFDDYIFAYYFDISFKETLKRHQQKPNSGEFGEKEMRKWWLEHDYLKQIEERKITEDMVQQDIVNSIFYRVKAYTKG